MSTDFTLKEKLADARAEVDRLERAMHAADCAEAGHDWISIGGANAGCHPECGCSVPVFECRRCGLSDYGINEQAKSVVAECEITNGSWDETTSNS